MKTNVKTTLLTAALVAVAGAIATQVKKRGVRNTVEGIKDGGTKVLDAGKKSILQLVSDNTDKAGDGGSIEGVGGQLTSDTNEGDLGDRALERVEG